MKYSFQIIIGIVLGVIFSLILAGTAIITVKYCWKNPWYAVICLPLIVCCYIVAREIPPIRRFIDKLIKPEE